MARRFTLRAQNQDNEGKAKHMRDIDGNVFYDEDGKSISMDSQSSNPFESQSNIFTRSLAEQFIFVYTEYEDYLGSTYEKHIRLVKYFHVHKYCLRNPKSLIYPSIDSCIVNFNKLNLMTSEQSVSYD